LKIVGNEIAKSDWSENSKRVVWTAACMLFFGSFRGGGDFSKNWCKNNEMGLSNLGEY